MIGEDDMQITLKKEDILNRLVSVHTLSQRSSVFAIPSVVRVIGFHTPAQDTLDRQLASRITGYVQQDAERLLNEHKLVRMYDVRGKAMTICPHDRFMYQEALVPSDEQELRFILGNASSLLTSLDMSALDLMHLIANLLPRALEHGPLSEALLIEQLAELVSEYHVPGDREVWAWPSPVEHETLGETLVRVLLPGASLSVPIMLVSDPKSSGYLLALTTPETDLNNVTNEEHFAYRYLHAYGPSDCKEFALWAGISISHAERLWNLLDPSKLIQVSWEDKPAWMLVSDLEHLESIEPPTGLRLIDAYDPFLQLPKRSLLIHGKRQHTHFFRSDVRRGMVLSDGRCVASWRMKCVKQYSSFVVEDIGEPLERVAVEELEQEAYTMTQATGTQFSGLTVE